MQRTTLLILFSLISPLIYSQCPTGNVNLGTQTHVDDFIYNYPTCEIIDGDLIIGSGVTDISGLTYIKRIEGSLRILYSDITSVSNFSNLDFIGGDFQIKENTYLTSIEGMNSLQNIGGELNIYTNFGGLSTIKGFNSLVSVGANFDIIFNPSLQHISGFNNLTNVPGRLSITNNNSLLSIPSFNQLLAVGNNLSIEGNGPLVQINGFNALETIGWDLTLGNSFLVSIQGFANLKIITRFLNISTYNPIYSPLLTTIPQFNSLKLIGAGFEITKTAITNLSGFNSLTSIGSLNTGSGWFILLDNHNLLTIDGFNNLNKIHGVVQIFVNNSLENISGFNQLTSVGMLQLNLNPALTSLDGLENLVNVDGQLYIVNNISLTDCSALCNLLSMNGVADTIEISGNPSMCSSQAEIEQDCIPDFDKDGILNDDDLDDDNDGILDSVEQNGDIYRDSDNDNYPDHMDLDSDNDGCFDVIEAGFTDNDQNGTLGSLPDLVDINGLIIGASDGYTIPLDNNSDSVFDFQQANTLSAGENGNLEICINTNAVDLFYSLTGSPDAGGVWTPSLASGTGVFDPSTDTAGVYTYTVTNGICGSDTSEVNVTIDVLPNAGEDGDLEICENSPSVDLFYSLPGTPDIGGIWTPTLNSGTGMFDPSVDAPGIYTYTVTNGTCGTDTSEVNVVAAAIPNAGEDGDLEICENSPSVDLFYSLPGTPDIGGIWTPTLNSGTGMFNPSVDASGVYTYTVTNAICNIYSSEVEVVVYTTPNAGENNSISICINSGLVNLFDNLGDGVDSSGTWIPELAHGNGLFDPLLDSAGQYTYIVSNGFCGNDEAVVFVNIVDIQDIPNVEIEITDLSDNNSIDVHIVNNSNQVYEFSLNDSDYQTSNNFESLVGGVYTLRIREINGCGVYEEDIYVIGYPKFFTPNNDGNNDTWYLYDQGNSLGHYTVYIFDRYGKNVAQLNSNNEEWDGTLNGKNLPETDYWFKIISENRQVKSGHFSLKR